MITKPKSGFKINPLNTLSRGIIGWYLFNEGNGPVVLNQIDNRSVGNLINFDINSAWVGSEHGGALAFDGSNDYVDVNIGHELAPGFSITGLVRPNVDSSTGIMVSGSLNNGLLDRYDVQLSVGNFRFDLYGNGELISMTHSASVLGGLLYFFAATYDGLTMSLYVNNLLPVIATGPTLVNSGNTVSTYFGRRTDFFDIFLSGYLDDIKIYNRRLSDFEIAQTFYNPYSLSQTTTTTTSYLVSFIPSDSLGGRFANIIRRRRRLHR